MPKHGLSGEPTRFQTIQSTMSVPRMPSTARSIASWKDCRFTLTISRFPGGAVAELFLRRTEATVGIHPH
jgi:hypothetical protein